MTDIAMIAARRREKTAFFATQITDRSLRRRNGAREDQRAIGPKQSKLEKHVTYDHRNDPVLSAALAYWQRKRGAGVMPARQDIDPAEMPKLLPHVQLIELVADRFRYRLIGTALVEAFGREYTGLFVDELVDGARAQLVREACEMVRDRRQPVFLRNRYVTAKTVDLTANRLYLPLSEDGSIVNMIFSALTFEFGNLPVAGAWGSATLAAGERILEPVDPS
jgi:hypothetical protein